MKSFPYKLYLVVSEEFCLGRSVIDVVRKAVDGGVDIVQLREKRDTTSRFIDKASILKELLDSYDVPLIINDNVEVAKSVNAYGVHVGNSDMSPIEIRDIWHDCMLLGYSIENISQMSTDEATVSDYLAVSPVFSTATKTDTICEWGLGGVSKIRSFTEKPLVAIGSLNKDNAADVIRAGADCLAVVSAICGADDPCRAAADIRRAIDRAI